MKKSHKSNLISLVALLVIALSPPAFSFDLIIPDTGQNFCYDWNSIMCDEFHEEDRLL